MRPGRRSRRDLLPAELKNLKKGDLVIWEDWFAVIENGMNEEKLEAIPNLVKLQIFNASDPKGISRFVIFQQQ